MPIYTYVSASGKTVEKLMKFKDKKESIEIDGEVYTIQVPKKFNSVTMEMRDARTGKRTRKDIEKKLKERSKRHHDKYELADKIDKEGLDTAKRLDWLKKVKRT